MTSAETEDKMVSGRDFSVGEGRGALYVGFPKISFFGTLVSDFCFDKNPNRFLPITNLCITCAISVTDSSHLSANRKFEKQFIFCLAV